jgi:hypothetical protein
LGHAQKSVREISAIFAILRRHKKIQSEIIAALLVTIFTSGCFSQLSKINLAACWKSQLDDQRLALQRHCTK